MNACPRCRAHAAEGQEYCLECGLRLPGERRTGPPSDVVRSRRLPLVATAAVAAAGAAAAVPRTRGARAPPHGVTAPRRGNHPPQPRPAAKGLAAWPKARDGWTVVLVSVPKKKGGRKKALARARHARSRGLAQVGIVDSGTISSLHPGYWVVFTGIYDTEPEATSALQRARAVARTASTRRLVS